MLFSVLLKFLNARRLFQILVDHVSAFYIGFWLSMLCNSYRLCEFAGRKKVFVRFCRFFFVYHGIFVFRISISSHHSALNVGSIILANELIVLSSLMDQLGDELQHQFLIGGLRFGDGWDGLELGSFLFHRKDLYNLKQS